MDDMVDLASDLDKRRHNFVISLIHHGTASPEKDDLKAMLVSEKMPQNKTTLLIEFPSAHQQAAKTAHRFLQGGLQALFSETHQFLVTPTLSFLSKRIGAEGFMSAIER
jgi:hypothetical protein